MLKALLGLLVAGIVLAATFWLQQDSARSVRTISVVRDSIEARLQLTGTVTNDRTVRLTALLDGEIMAIRAREGDQVEAGAILAELDSRQAQALLDKAAAELVLQRQSLDAATRDYERLARLFRAGTASEQAFDASQDARLAAEAAVAAAEATLALNQLRLDNAVIRAPFAGTVIDQSAETGQWLEAGQPLFELVATEGFVIEAPVSASDWSRLQVGQIVELSTEVEPAIRWTSRVSWIAPTVQKDASGGNTVAVRFPLGEQAPPLLLGQEVDADLSVDRVDDVLVVPFTALQEGDEGDFHAYVMEDGRARLRQVSIGLTSLNHAQVLSGLAEGERVILPEGTPLRDGQAVQS